MGTQDPVVQCFGLRKGYMFSRPRKFFIKIFAYSQIKERSSLTYVIGSDLLRYGKLPIFLLISIITTATFIVKVTYETRVLTTYRSQLLLEKDALDIEWRHLILEKNSLTDHRRIESVATSILQMQCINPLQENIIFLSKVQSNR